MSEACATPKPKWKNIAASAERDDYRPGTGDPAADKLAKLLRSARRAFGDRPIFAGYGLLARFAGMTVREVADAGKLLVAAGLVDFDCTRRHPCSQAVWQWRED